MELNSDLSILDARKHREKVFHDQTFAREGQGRGSADKYYAISGSSIAFYEDFLRSHCRRRRVLEYGCGPDGHSLFLARHEARVTGIDISDVAITESRRRAERQQVEGADFQVMDAEALEFPASTFDLICGLGILHHLNLRRAYSELARTLKPDGSAVFIECLGHNPLINLYRHRTPGIRTEDEHPLLASDLELAREYFGTVEARYFYLFTLAAAPFRRLPGFPLLLKAVEGLDRALFRALPFLGKYAWRVGLVLSRPRKAGPLREGGAHQRIPDGEISGRLTRVCAPASLSSPRRLLPFESRPRPSICSAAGAASSSKEGST